MAIVSSKREASIQVRLKSWLFGPPPAPTGWRRPPFAAVELGEQRIERGIVQRLAEHGAAQPDADHAWQVEAALQLLRARRRRAAVVAPMKAAKRRG